MLPAYRFGPFLQTCDVRLGGRNFSKVRNMPISLPWTPKHLNVAFCVGRLPDPVLCDQNAARLQIRSIFANMCRQIRRQNSVKNPIAGRNFSKVRNMPISLPGTPNISMLHSAAVACPSQFYVTRMLPAYRFGPF